MNWSDDQQPYDNGENAIRNAENGYWKSVDALKIPTSTAIVGVKIILEFYEGQAPSGKRTGWVMHEYEVKHNDEANVPQDYKSLCTIFLQGDKKFNAEDRQVSLNANAPNDRLESYLQYLAEIEEQNAAMNSQVCIFSFMYKEWDIFFEVDEDDIIETFMFFRKRRLKKSDK